MWKHHVPLSKSTLAKIIHHQLIVSCQAVDDEPLNNKIAVSLMAKACVEGGARFLRISQPHHIKKIMKLVNVPMIGIIKKHYQNSAVFITPTLKEVKKLIKLGVDIIALDATLRHRPKENLKDIVEWIKTNHPDRAIMADCSNEEDVLHAQKLGFDYIGTTLRGYTKETKDHNAIEKNFQFLKWCTNNVNTPIILEGQVKDPFCVKKAFKTTNVCAVVVGSVITRPQVIVETFLEIIKTRKR